MQHYIPPKFNSIILCIGNTLANGSKDPEPGENEEIYEEVW